MKTQLFSLSLCFAATAALLATPARADDDDKAACVGLEEGDDCTRGDGDPGICVPDDSDPVLTCDDDGFVGDDGSGDCSLAGGGSDAFGLAAAALGLAAALRRRR